MIHSPHLAPADDCKSKTCKAQEKAPNADTETEDVSVDAYRTEEKAPDAYTETECFPVDAYGRKKRHQMHALKRKMFQYLDACRAHEKSPEASTETEDFPVDQQACSSNKISPRQCMEPDIAPADDSRLQAYMEPDLSPTPDCGSQTCSSQKVTSPADDHTSQASSMEERRTHEYLRELQACNSEFSTPPPSMQAQQFNITPSSHPSSPPSSPQQIYISTPRSSPRMDAPVGLQNTAKRKQNVSPAGDCELQGNGMKEHPPLEYTKEEALLVDACGLQACNVETL